MPRDPLRLLTLVKRFGTRDIACMQPQTLEEIKTAHIRLVIGFTGGNLSEAAKILDIDRRTLYRNVAERGLRGIVMQARRAVGGAS